MSVEDGMNESGLGKRRYPIRLFLVSIFVLYIIGCYFKGRMENREAIESSNAWSNIRYTLPVFNDQIGDPHLLARYNTLDELLKDVYEWRKTLTAMPGTPEEVIDSPYLNYERDFTSFDKTLVFPLIWTNKRYSTTRVDIILSNFRVTSIDIDEH